MSWEIMQNGFLRLILFSPFSFVQPRVTNENDIFLSFTVNLNLIMSPGFISCVSVSSGICSIKHKSYKNYKKESVSCYSFIL